MRTRHTIVALALAALAGLSHAQHNSKSYIIELSDPPAAGYDGRIAGLAGTKPAAGQRFNINAAATRSYVAFLDNRRASVMSAAGVSPRAAFYNYRVAFNGFAARLTPDQVRRLANTAGVKAIYADEARKPDTISTPDFLGLTAANGVWSKVDSSGTAVKGEGVIIGVVDTGVWPENPSFSDKVDAQGKPVSSHEPGTVVFDPLPAGRFNGICQAGEGFTAAMCNNKLVGAQYFRAGFEASGQVPWPLDYASPRDEDGHGSHTASTAGGNQDVDATLVGSPMGPMSGMAPRARIAAYKVCFSYEDGAPEVRANTCYTSDSMNAIDTAVGDGVDVINYSIGGSQVSYLDPVEVAFFWASAGGVFVSASAGNSGPANTVAHISPWIMTTAASTHDRTSSATVTIGDGSTATGASFQTTGVPTTPFIWSRDAGTIPYASLSAGNQTGLARCFSAADLADPATNTIGATADALLDPAKVAGKVVLCERGSNVLVNKSGQVAESGGVAMVLQNIPGGANTTLALPHIIPTVHLDVSYYTQTTTHAATTGATAAFSPSVRETVLAPLMADFSSRGPNRGDPNVLKPDITAPGVDVIAAYTDTSIGPAEHAQILAGTLVPPPGFEMLQGTSMSSPHVAGIGALLKQQYPTWSPGAIKSALMTSTTPVLLASGAVDTNRWGYGSGHVAPNPALQPGLVYDIGFPDFFGYAVGGVNGTDLNLASITASSVLGQTATVRTVTNVGSAPATYTASAALAGFNVTVDPSSLTLEPDESASYVVTIERTSAPLGTYVFGNLAWSDGATTVTSPLTARAQALSTPAVVSSNRFKGTKMVTVGTGYDGSMTAAASGLEVPDQSGDDISTGQDHCWGYFNTSGSTWHLRAATYNDETAPGTDLDLEVYRATASGWILAGASGNIDSNELVDLSMPVGGSYVVCVVGYETPGDAPVPYLLNVWTINAPAGPQTLRVGVPSKVYLNRTATAGFSWSVPPGSRYLGAARFFNGASVIGQTLVEIDSTLAGTTAGATSARASRSAVQLAKPLRGNPGTLRPAK